MNVRHFGGMGKMIHNIDWDKDSPIFVVFNELAGVENSISSFFGGRLDVPEEWTHELMLEAEKKAIASLMAIASALSTD